MRIDREAFLVAVAALAGCERADPSPPPAPPPQRVVVAPIEIPRPAATIREATPDPTSIVESTPPPQPAPARSPARHHRATAKEWFLGLSAATREHVTMACAQRAHRACERSLRAMMPQPPAPIADLDGDVTTATDPSTAAPTTPEAELEPAVDSVVANLAPRAVDAYCKEDFPPPSCETPLVVAFDGQPVDFAPATGAPFAFVPGRPIATDWPTAATPWIALDLDADGSITSGAELFGSSTILPGGGRADNGFLALAPLDANGDGVLDARDPMFARLVLWSDRNGDHRSSPDELQALSSVVTEISLAHTRDARCNTRDDCEGERGALHWSDARGAAHVGTVVDVYIPRP